jgi:uncharacterized protein
VSVLHAIVAGLLQAVSFLWDSLFGLIFGFLVSATVQVVLTPAAMERFLGPNLKGVLYGAGFGIISSACSYGAAAAARGFYRAGADVRSVFAFLISSTNMNLAILILFWSLLGWRFAFAEFFGGVIIIAVVVAGFDVFFRRGELERLGAQFRNVADVMKDESCHDPAVKPLSQRSLGSAATWREVGRTAIDDLRMLRSDLILGYLIAGYASALIPPETLAGALRSVGSVPFVGYVVLLLVGLLIAVVTFVCSMGNVPIARYLANAGIPLGANTTFIYGDLLIPPLIAVYCKSFPRKIVWSFVVLFIVGAMIAGAVMERLIGSALGGVTTASMTLNDRFTLISNIVAVVAVAAVALAASRAPDALREG